MVQTERERACPCHHFRSVENVAVALESPERMCLLISWLSGDSENYCGTYNCSNRVETSLAILNAVRDACRIFLEDNNNKNQTTEASYEQSFPALSVKPKKCTSSASKNSLQGGNKRRIRPATLTLDSNASAWGAPKGNLVDLPSEVPLDMPTQKHFAKAFATKPKPTTFALDDTSLQFTNAFVTPEKTGAFRWEGEKPAQPVFAPDGDEDFLKSVSLKHLIDVYATLIDSCLVPSTPLELHLLFRLLVLPNETKYSGVLSTSPLGSILFNNPTCIYFAKESLQRQGKVLFGLGPVIWKALVQCSPIRDVLPGIYDECDRLLREFDGQDILPGFFTSYQTALLALPFDEEKDSRHNFRSPQDQAIYMNREASRDAFLYQLRSFLSVRGKVIDAAKVDKVLLSIKRSSRSVIEGLMETNLTWFSSFFLDLLLQIGLVPLQETDKELLQIADKDKLQKLHQRFSQSASQSRSSSLKVAADPTRNSASPQSEALNLFPGHQEFFFIFILSADSYAFAIHLRRVIINKMMNTINEDKFDERRVRELCMLARYAGLLFFSPNWRAFGTTNEELSVDPALDALLQLAACGLSIISILESAHSNNKLHLTAPWVVELLQMSSWDITAMKSKTYMEVLSILRQLQQVMTNEAIGMSGGRLVSLTIESFFGNAIGIATASKLAPRTLPDTLTGNGTLDIFAAIPPSALFSCIAYLEDLTSLLSRISRAMTGSAKSPGVSRKLRPSMLSHVASPSPPKIKAFGQEPRPEAAMSSKLRDGFFHRQPEMKLICEFVIPRVLRKLRVEEIEREVEAEMKSRCLPQVESTEFQESLIVACCNDIFRKRLEEHLQKSLELLSPVQLDRRIISAATSLGIEYGIEKSNSSFQQIVASQRARWMKLTADVEKELFPIDSNNTNRSTKAIDRCIESINRLVGVLSDSLTLSQAAPVMQDATRALQILFNAIFKLDTFSADILIHALSIDEKTGTSSWEIMSGYLLLAAEIQRWSHHGLSVLKRRCAEVKMLCGIISLGASASSPAQVAELSSRMTNTKIWKSALVEASLRKLCSDGCENASHILAEHIGTRK